MRDEFPLIEVAGSPYELGFQHGAMAAALVRRHLDWIETFTGVSRDVLCRNARAFLPAIEALSPSYVDEIRGLAEGAGITFEEALLCQVRGEAARVSGAEPTQHDQGCTAFAFAAGATADGLPVAGQNLDLDSEYEDFAILLRVTPDDGRPLALMLTFAGQLGYAGMNEYGVAIFNNILGDFEWRQALPRQPVKRLMLEQSSVNACIGLLDRWRTCSAANVVMCDRHEIADVEARPEGTAVYHDERPECRLHTNHYLTPQFAGYETDSIRDSRARLARIRELSGAAWGKIETGTMKDWLADHEGDPAGICRHGESGWHSIAGCIAEPAKGLLHVRRGHGCTGAWHTYEVKAGNHGAHSH